jgi:DNA-binding XRE family transcriptional regulator
MKHYVFGDTVKGFIDYLRSIWRMKADIKNYEYSRNEEYKRYRYQDYREAKEGYEQFKEFRKVLFENELATIEAVMKHEEYDDVLLHAIFDKWHFFMFVINKGFLEEISNEQVGKAIVEARTEACFNRRQLAEILGISYNALRLYEEGKRTVPFNVFYKMSQFLELKIYIR